VNVVSVCAGYGGLDLGLRIAVPDARTVLFVEREAAPVEVLAARMRDGHLDQAPIWSDLCTLDGEPWRGVVDCIAAGIPCQPWSVAGKRGGFGDERHLGEELVRVVGEMGPRFVFVENVPGFVRVGLPDLLGRLADLGFDAEWGVFSSAGVGAPHLRKRAFVLAYAAESGLEIPRPGGRRQPRAQAGEGLDGRPQQQGGELADAGHGLPQGFEPGRAEARPTRRGGGAEVGRPPGPSGDWSGIPKRLHPAVEPGLRRVADGAPGRVDRLRMLGNGVDPLVAAHAWAALSRRIQP
jgi:DNA (cytosine-5)-methyltransferase 1